MYILPNKKQINMGELEKAFLDFNPNKKYYLDAETGKIIFEQNKKKIEEKIDQKYFAVPKLPKSKMIAWMKELVDEMIARENPNLAIKLYKTLVGENPIEEFMKILSADESGWIHGWSQWEIDHVYEEIEEWFCQLPIDIVDDMSELDDDCPLCRMMKEGVNDYETVKRGFQEANAKQMVDDIFKDKDNSRKCRTS